MVVNLVRDLNQEVLDIDDGLFEWSSRGVLNDQVFDGNVTLQMLIVDRRPAKRRERHGIR